MIDAFLISFFNTFVLLIWFKTHAFIEYFKYIPLTNKIIKSYQESIKAGLNIDFINFLSLNYDCFLVRLLTCPFCLNFWISIVTSFFVGYKFFALIYISSMIYYKIVNILSNYERN
jgi:hypothetical protein